MSRTGVRSLCLEKILRSVSEIPCPEPDCNIKLSFDEMEEHYTYCPHRSVRCPVYGCGWTGKSNTSVNHIEDIHESMITPLSSTGYAILRVTNPLEGSIDMCSQCIVRRADDLFIVTFWVVKDQPSVGHSVVVTSTYIGDPLIGKNYVVKLSVATHPSHCTISCSRIPWTLLDQVSVISRNPNNLVIPWETAISSNGAEYRDNDQLHKYPQPSGLELNVTVRVTEKVTNDIGNSRVDALATLLEMRPEDV